MDNFYQPFHERVEEKDESVTRAAVLKRRVFDKSDPIEVRLPSHMNVEIIKTDTGEKGNTAQGATKPAILESGLMVHVPLFIKEGDLLRIDTNKKIHLHDYQIKKQYNPCIFEYVYLARPDSVIDKINVYQSRLEMGKKLADKIKSDLTEDELKNIDVVMPIPDTSKTSALPLSIKLNKKLREGFIKNRYIGRTFIMPGQKIRKKSVKQKLNTINIEFENDFTIEQKVIEKSLGKLSKN